MAPQCRGKSCRAPRTDEPEQQPGISLSLRAAAQQSTVLPAAGGTAPEAAPKPAPNCNRKHLKQSELLSRAHQADSAQRVRGTSTQHHSWERICIPSLLCLGSPSRDESAPLPSSDSELPKPVQCLPLALMRATLDMITQMDKFCSKSGICHFSHNLCRQHTPKGQAGSY